jgi:hypothetical protein
LGLNKRRAEDEDDDEYEDEYEDEKILAKMSDSPG